MPEAPTAAHRLYVPSLRPILARHSVAAFLVLVHAIITTLALLASALTRHHQSSSW